MIAMFRKRLVDSALSLFCLICAVFFLARMTGSPAALYLPLNATPQMIENFNREQGFDRPQIMQFLDFFWHAIRLDFGDSLRRQSSALSVVLQAYPTTLYLAAVTIAVALVIGIVVGCLASLVPNSIFDRAATAFAVSAASIPDFWLALLCILVFAVAFGWLPTSGMGTPLHWVLPVLVLMTRPAGSLVQVVRGSMVETLSSSYVKSARGRGIPTTRILFLHALRNAGIPAITVLGVQAAGILNGAVVVETIFGWPGIGRLMITAVLDRDFAVVQAAVVVIALAIFALNMVIDLIYGILDPRVRT